MKSHVFLLLALGLFSADAMATSSPGQPAPVPPILDATAIKDGFDGRASVDPCDDF